MIRPLVPVVALLLATVPSIAAQPEARGRQAQLEELVDLAGTVKRFDPLLGIEAAAPAAPAASRSKLPAPPTLPTVVEQCRSSATAAAPPARFCEIVVTQFARHELRKSIIGVVDAQLAGSELEQELAYLKSPAVTALAKVQLPLREATAPIERDWLAEASRIATAAQVVNPPSLPKAPRRAEWLDDVLLATVGVDRAGLRHRLIESARRMIEARPDRWSSPAMTNAAELAARRYEDAVEATLGANGPAIADGLDVDAKRQHEQRLERINGALAEMWAATRPALDAHVAARLAELRTMTPAQKRAAYPD